MLNCRGSVWMQTQPNGYDALFAEVKHGIR